MDATLKQLTTPTVEPLTLDDAKHFLDVTHDDDNDLITDLIIAARLQCEYLTGRDFVNQKWQLTITEPHLFGYRAFPLLGYMPLPSGESISLQNSPIVSVESVTVDGVPLDASLYDVGEKRITLKSYHSGKIVIVYIAGYGPTADDVPRNVVQAIRVLTAFYYEHRSSDAETPSYVEKLLARQKIYFYA